MTNTAPLLAGDESYLIIRGNNPFLYRRVVKKKPKKQIRTFRQELERKEHYDLTVQEREQSLAHETVEETNLKN